MILWAVSREVRSLYSMALEQARGIPLDRIFANQRPPIWDKRKPLLSRALERHPARVWAELLRLAQQADEQIKGQAEGSEWDTLARILVRAAGVRLPISS